MGRGFPHLRLEQAPKSPLVSASEQTNREVSFTWSGGTGELLKYCLDLLTP